MKIYRFEMVLVFALLCLCSWTSVIAQAGEEVAVDCTDAVKSALPVEDDSCELLADVEVKKSSTIAELKDSLVRMANIARTGNYALAQSLLDASVCRAHRRYPNMEDEDIRFIVGIVDGYRRQLRVYNEYSRKRECGVCR